MKRNGELDAFRFVFACMVAMYHVRTFWGAPNPPFANGWLGVEFFYILTGTLLAKRAFSRRKTLTDEEFTGECWSYTLKKISYIYPYFLAALVVAWVGALVDGKDLAAAANRALSGAPHLLFLDIVIHRNGGLYVKGTWYLSIMFLCVFILYPLLLRFGEVFSRLVAPAFFVVVSGYLIFATGNIHPISGGAINYGFLRGLSDMCLGFCVYELIPLIRSAKLSGAGWTLAKAAAYLVAMVFSAGAWGEEMEYTAMLCVGLAIAISCAGVGACLPQSGWTDHLSKLSLIVYLTHPLIMKLADKLFPSRDGAWMAFFAAGALVASEAFCVAEAIYNKKKREKAPK